MSSPPSGSSTGCCTRSSRSRSTSSRRTSSTRLHTPSPAPSTSSRPRSRQPRAGCSPALAARWSTARPLRRVGRDAAWLGGATAAAALAVLPFAVPYALLEAGGELPDNTTHLVMSSLPALRCYLFGSYLIPNVQVPPAAWLLAIPGTIVLALGGRAE